MRFGLMFFSSTDLALAMITRNVQLRAGSLISPLHDPIRIAEEWSVVDNLSHGRVAISFGSGWNADDFVFYPERYATRHKIMYEQINLVKTLWRGESITRTNSFGKPVEIVLSPKPIQGELPIWITSSGNPETFARAGAEGANLLTHLLGHDIAALSEKIRLYRNAREEHGFHSLPGTVSLMLHTFIGSDMDAVRATVRQPFRQYLRSAVSLERKSAASGGVISGGKTIPPDAIAPQDMEEMLDQAFERYFRSAALLGTPESCRAFVRQLSEIGVDEIACLIDFGVAHDEVLASLPYLNDLRESFTGRSTSSSLNAFLEPIDETAEYGHSANATASVS